MTSTTENITRFQLTRSRGARQATKDHVKATAEISTHALTWSATQWARVDNGEREISTHALTWSATGACRYEPRKIMISTHALTWSATLTVAPTSVLPSFQLTRSRGARLLTFSKMLEKRKISTHALTWSATFCSGVSMATAGISTHALTWSATRDSESDIIDWLISTHALTWSATKRPYKLKIRVSDFNSRAHVERDLRGCVVIGLCGVLFQLTRSRGARPGRGCDTRAETHFNSRAHVERDARR